MKIKNSINRTSIFLAATSFLIGTFLFLYFLANVDNTRIIETGRVYTISACLLNFIVLCILVYAAFSRPKIREETLKTITIILINIQVAIPYMVIAIAQLFSSWPD